MSVSGAARAWLWALAIALLGCSDAPSTEAADAALASDAATPSLFDARYCEVLLVHVEGSNARIEVFNTLGLNQCPQADWDNLDADQLSTDHNAFRAILNGPRYFTVDGGEAGDAVTGEMRNFGGVDMHKVAELHMTFDELIAMQQSSTSYAEIVVTRDNRWHFEAGREVYELVSDTGATYIMQSYSHQVDDTLRAAQLSGLSGRLSVPAGWSFRARTLDSRLTVQPRDSAAVVIQDELRNTYQLRAP